MSANSNNILEVKNIEVVYDNVILALHDVSLTVPKGKIVALLGANGAGKSTTLKSISTMLASERGKVTKGTINYNGNNIEGKIPSQMVHRGMVQVLEGRRCFGHLTVEENIIAGAYSRQLSKGDLSAGLEKIYTYFTRLKDRRGSQAGFTSGGEQQMIAVARAMMAKPTMLLLDEPSMGLAPQLVAEIFNIVKELNQKEGVSILLAEQNTNIALKNADYGYILETGRVMLEGTAQSLSNDEKVKELYLGISKGERKNFRDALYDDEKKKNTTALTTKGRKFKIGEPVLEVKNISLHFGGVKAITNISFNILKHEIRAIIGPNGAGKSSMLNCINGIYKPQEGTILYKGAVIDQINPNLISRMGISRTFQNLALFKRMSVLDNILVGRKLHTKSNFMQVGFQFPQAVREEKENKEKCEEIISFLEIEDIKNTQVGKLPYGLQKKVELGRALATQAEILLLDEPMAGMNVEEKRDMCRFILKVNDELGTTIVLIEHDMGVVMDISDRVVVLDYGKSIGDGTPDVVRANPKVIDAYLGVAHD